MIREWTPALAALLASCTAVIDQSTFYPQAGAGPTETLAAPEGYRVEHAMLDLPGLGVVHTARLDNPASEATLLYAGGNMNFVAGQTLRAAALARATGADILLYDYPGRGGTTVPATVDASIAFGPAFLQALRDRGWIGGGPLWVYGLSFGGSQAAGIARAAKANGLIIEGSAADLAAVGRNFVPRIVKPFVKLRVDPDLARYDYAGYAVAARAPVLLIASKDDEVVTPRNMTAFGEQLRAQGVDVRSVTVPGPHGTALRKPAAIEAIRSFTAAQSR